MGVLDILGQLGQGLVERDRTRALGPNYREKWQQYQDEHVRSQIQNAVSNAELQQKALDIGTTLSAAKIAYPDAATPEEALARLTAEKTQQGMEHLGAQTKYLGSQAEWMGGRVGLEQERMDLQRQIAEARDATARAGLQVQLAKIEGMLQGQANRPEPGSYQWVMGPDQKPHLVNPKSGKEFTFGGEMAQQPPTNTQRDRVAAMGRTAPILDQIESLSLGGKDAKGNMTTGINTGTSGPLGRVGGAFKSAAGYLNLDPQVRLYESLIKGMIPMVARAVGHTGVLTEQDVQSVRALFPNPGDSEDLARAKINQVRNLMGSMTGINPATPDQSQTTPAVRRYNPATGQIE